MDHLQDFKEVINSMYVLPPQGCTFDVDVEVPDRRAYIRVNYNGKVILKGYYNVDYHHKKEIHEKDGKPIVVRQWDEEGGSYTFFPQAVDGLYYCNGRETIKNNIKAYQADPEGDWVHLPNGDYQKRRYSINR